MTAGRLRERVAFDAPVTTDDGFGGETSGWEDAADAVETWAEFIHAGGSEAVEAARLSGREVYRVRLRSSSATRAIRSDWRMRDLRRGTVYQVRSVDDITEPAWVHVRVESGVAV